MKPRMKRMAAGATAALTVAVATVLGTGTAQAATTKFCVQPFNRSGSACFYSDSDKFELNDLYADGMREVVIWNTSYGRSGECTDADGSKNGYTYCDYDFTEGTNVTVTFVAVARDGANGANKYPSNVVTAWVSGRG